ncbi:MAG: hydrogenase maturation protease [Deltaproteobacteria bacterium]|nr:hydrogenase maturation protease [Deltaproteobacteria bacterium]
MFDEGIKLQVDRIVAEAKRGLGASSLDVVGAPITVVGAGNWLISYDCIGPRVLDLVDGRYGPTEVELRNSGSHGLSLLDHLHGQDVMIVVDACVLGGQPGEVKTLVDPPLDGPVGRESSVHQLGPIETLTVARLIDPLLMPQRLVLVLVETHGINPEIEEQACQQAVAVIDREIEVWRSGSGSRKKEENM